MSPDRSNGADGPGSAGRPGAAGHPNDAGRPNAAGRSAEAEGIEAERIEALFADLEAQELGRVDHERMGELGDLVAGEFADHGLAHRLAGAIGTPIDVHAGGAWFDGLVDAVGQQWVLLRGHVPGAPRALLNLAGVDHLRLRRVAHGSDAVISQLSIRSPLRRFADGVLECRVYCGHHGHVLDGRIDAVGADYLQLRRGATVDLVPLSALIAVQDIALS
ncbi:hypothetical protein [Brevibacterium otitidis]|uniref:Uncharacterized protein n=2 Tax=Brevibacterium otitidis TaxID=53364 RepID=A0ABV5X5V9_9MICO|nr:hypothetical protein GCM10023233_17720 [Brevibacterium otitidis]